MDFENGKVRIFLDLDSVTCDFSKAMCETMGIDPTEPNLRKKLETHTFVSDVVDSELFWGRVKVAGEHWWANIPLFPWTNILWARLNAIAPVCFLTAPHEYLENGVYLTDHASVAGKSMWIQKNFNTDLFFIGKRKYFCANSNTILVDDYVRNIKRFVAAGGIGYLWPNPDRLKNEGTWEKEIDKLVAFVKEAIRGL